MTLFEWRSLILRSRLSPRARLVAFALAQRMDADTLECWPGVARIAADCGYANERTVQRALRELQRSGYLWIGRRGYGPRKQDSNMYRAARPKYLPRVEPGRHDDPAF